jgi:hypothetical protein
VADHARVRLAHGERAGRPPAKIVGLWREARTSPFLAIKALQAYRHISPWDFDADGNQRWSGELLDLAAAGALLDFEGIMNTRGMVQHPLQINFLEDGPSRTEFDVMKPPVDFAGGKKVVRTNQKQLPPEAGRKPAPNYVPGGFRKPASKPVAPAKPAPNYVVGGFRAGGKKPPT